LSDSDAITIIRAYAAAKPFPKEWNDKAILGRLRQAEKETARGKAVAEAETRQARKQSRKAAEREKLAQVSSGMPTIDLDPGRTEIANAQRLVAMHGRDMRFCDPFGKWFIWDGARWRMDDRRDAERLAKQVSQALWREIADCLGELGAIGGSDETDEMVRFAKKSSEARGVERAE